MDSLKGKTEGPSPFIREAPMKHSFALAEPVTARSAVGFLLLKPDLLAIEGSRRRRRGGSGPAERPSSTACRVAPFRK